MKTQTGFIKRWMNWHNSEKDFTSDLDELLKERAIKFRNYCLKNDVPISSRKAYIKFINQP